jgi:hypothetical protein
MRESKFVKVMGILAIIFGAIGIVANLVSVIVVASTNSWYYAILGISKGALIVAGIIAILASAAMLFSGLLGLKYWNIQSEAAACVGAAIITLALMVIVNLITVIGGRMNVLNLLSGLAIPVLSLIAAIQFKNHPADDTVTTNM